jgi:hypothetical protein
MMTLQAEISPTTDAAAAKSAIKSLLRDRFGIDHSTVELDRVKQVAGEIVEETSSDDQSARPPRTLH